MVTINRTWFTGILIFILLMQGCTFEENPPNIILIMADDLGYRELGSYGQEIIRTPNLDKLAEEGMRFTQYYAGSPVCAPSRCVLLTGQHTGHAFVRDNYELGGYTDEDEGGQLALPPGTLTIGSMLKDKGYTTAIIGKWGLGGPGSDGIPNKQGFDYFYGYLCQKQAHNFYPSHLWENEQWDTLNNNFFMAHQAFEGDPENLEDFKKYSGEDYSMDKMMEKAEIFINDNMQKPFFLYLPLTVPHLALQVPDESLEEYIGQFPDSAYLGNKGYLPHPYPRAAYAGMITRMDAEIGKLLHLLEEKGMADNTVIIFTSDNGPTYGGIGGSDTEFFKSAGELRGLKGSVYEGGIRVPMIIRWNGKVKAGETTNHISGFQDLLPTLAEIAGVQSPEATDGISFVPLLLGNEQAEHDYMYWEFPAYGGQQALRYGKWKAVRQRLKKSPAAPIQLYNLEDDIGETKDVSDKNPELVAKIYSMMKDARTRSEYFPFPALDGDSLAHQHN